MKTIRKFSILAVMLIFIAPLAFAQKDSKAKEILDIASEKYSKAGGISVNFSLNIKDIKAKLTQTFEGSILLKNDKFFLSTPDADTWFDGKTQWVYLKNAEEVNVSEPSGRDIQMMNPAGIFTLYQTGSKYKYKGEKTDIKKRPVYEIELTPMEKDGDIKKIVVQINKSDYMPVTFHVFSGNDIENILYVTTYKTGETFADDLFVYNKKKHPQAEIIDLR